MTSITALIIAKVLRVSSESGFVCSVAHPWSWVEIKVLLWLVHTGPAFVLKVVQHVVYTPRESTPPGHWETVMLSGCSLGHPCTQLTVPDPPSILNTWQRSLLHVVVVQVPQLICRLCVWEQSPPNKAIGTSLSLKHNPVLHSILS